MAQLNFERLSPESGVPGDAVELFASGLDTNAAYAVSINGVAATGLQVTANSLQFNVGAGTQSGEVAIAIAGGPPIPTQFHFLVERQISGQLVPPPGVSVAGYEIASFAGISTVLSNGNFSVRVPQSGAFVLTALRNTNDSFFYAVVTSSNATVTIDADSTAIALAFLNPLFTTRVDERARQLVDQLGNSSAVTSLSAAITMAAADGRSYYNDARVDSALEAVVMEIIGSPPLMPANLRVPSVLKGLNPDWIVPPPFDRGVAGNHGVQPDRHRAGWLFDRRLPHQHEPGQWQRLVDRNLRTRPVTVPQWPQ
ncbi:MAG: hypothetical protein ACPGVU_12740 [Limisphaerales bacterium]